MDFDGITGPWIVVLVALRQLSLPCGNRAFLRRG